MRPALLLLLASATGAPLAAQSATPASPPPAVVLGAAHRLHSEALGEDRPYFVYRQAAAPAGPQPVIILLDGDAHFHHTTGVARFLADQGRMPRALVVAVPNTTDRTRDLTPPVLGAPALRAQFPTAGGADRMLAFLVDELLPEVERTYGPIPFKVLIGHSFGGLFAAHAMFARPGAFDAYIAISPSLWWDGERLADSLAAHATASGSQSWFYATMGGLEPDQQTGPFGRAGHSVTRPDIRFVTYAADDHGSTPLKSTYDGLEAIFRPLRLPADSLVPLGITGIDRRFAEVGSRYRLFEGTPEVALNVLGYALLRENPARAVDAVAAFRENARRFPRSGNTYDSLGDGVLALENREAAMACFANAARVGIANPNEGQTVQGSVIAPLSYERMATLARELGKPVWPVTEIPASVEARCLAGAGG
jgi:hypothetical protein